MGRRLVGVDAVQPHMKSLCTVCVALSMLWLVLLLKYIDTPQWHITDSQSMSTHCGHCTQYVTLPALSLYVTIC